MLPFISRNAISFKNIHKYAKLCNYLKLIYFNYNFLFLTDLKDHLDIPLTNMKDSLHKQKIRVEINDAIDEKRFSVKIITQFIKASISFAFYKCIIKTYLIHCKNDLNYSCLI